MVEKTTSTFKRVQIIGDTAIVTSKIKFDTLLKMQKRNSNILCLAQQAKDGEILELFRIEAQPIGDFSDCGATFTSANKAGYAMTTVKIPVWVENKKEYFVEEYGTALCLLEELEEQVAKASKDIESAFKRIEEQIEEVA